MSWEEKSWNITSICTTFFVDQRYFLLDTGTMDSSFSDGQLNVCFFFFFWGRHSVKSFLNNQYNIFKASPRNWNYIFKASSSKAAPPQNFNTSDSVFVLCFYFFVSEHTKIKSLVHCQQNKEKTERAISSIFLYCLPPRLSPTPSYLTLVTHTVDSKPLFSIPLFSM